MELVRVTKKLKDYKNIRKFKQYIDKHIKNAYYYVK